jgi:hypothetical protein
LKENAEAKYMSIEKQKFYNEVEYLKLSYINNESLDSVTIKSKKDLKEKLQKGLDDIKENKTYSIYDVFSRLNNI